jgi:lipopolysaccharide transport system permease protein
MHQSSEIKIRPAAPLSLGLSDIWQSRELLYFFVWRDVKVKYKQTYLGILWAILQPVLLMLIFYFIFSRTLNIRVGMHYPVYAFSGLVLWGLFSSGITNSSESLLSNAPIIRKIYFPRILIPLASVLTALVDFLFAFLVLFVLLIIFQQPIVWTAAFFFPLAIIITFLSSFGIGSLIGALNVKYRDFRYLLPFSIQLLFFGSQVVYAIDTIQAEWIKNLLYLNPLNGALELFRQPFHGDAIYWSGVLISLGSLLFFLLAGVFYFKKTESYFADLV